MFLNRAPWRILTRATTISDYATISLEDKYLLAFDVRCTCKKDKRKVREGGELRIRCKFLSMVWPSLPLHPYYVPLLASSTHSAYVLLVCMSQTSFHREIFLLSLSTHSEFGLPCSTIPQHSECASVKAST